MSAIRHRVVGLGADPAPAWLTPERIAAVEAAEDLPFTEDEYANRLARVRHRMAQADVDAVAVFRPSSVEYLCGYHSAETLPQPLLVSESDTFLYVPDFEVGRALASSCTPNLRYFRYSSAQAGLELIAEHSAQVLPRRARIAVEMGHTATPPQLVELLRGRAVEVVDGEYLVERVRLVLSPAELRCVEEAAIGTQRGVEAAVEAARRPGATDSSVAAAISAALVTDANSSSAWGPTIATGRRAGIPHSTWHNVPVGPGTTFLEFSGAHHRYHAPVMRTLCRGRPSALVERLADLATTALATVLGTARAGMSCAEVARAAISAMGPLPDDVVFHQLFGYPVSLAHRPHWMDGAPFAITVDNRAPLEEGMVFHVPASFRAFGEAGVGLSQTFVVEAAGTRVLTHGSAELIRL